MRFLLLALLLTGCSNSKSRVVLYCAQDREFAEDLLATFKRTTDLTVAPKFDTEADKSVSLYIELVKEQRRPRCDVFWNNEILSTIRLQKQGFLESYNSPSARTLPEWAKANDHTWHAYAARARVLIVNTDLVAEKDRPLSLNDLSDSRLKDRVVMARPQFGTSATQAACLFSAMGEDGAKAFYRRLKKNGVHIAPGNKQVAEWVAKGHAPGHGPVWAGITDTDDAIIEVKAGRPVVIIFPDQQGENPLGTLFIPNTLALLKHGPNPAGGRKLIDYLLSAEVEKKLAEGESHPFPLHDGVEVTLPSALEIGRKVIRMKVDFHQAASLWKNAQRFVISEFAR